MMVRKILNLLLGRSHALDIRQQELAVVSADMSASYGNAEDIAADLDDRCDDIIQRISAHGGMLGSITNNAVLAVFGQARTLKRTALQAVNAGDAIQSQASGVGIASGQVFYGRKVSSGYQVAVVVGEPVRAASRLCELTGFYSVPALCTGKICSGAGTRHHFFLEIDRVMLANRNEGQPVYWPIPTDIIGAELRQELDMYMEGLQLYYSGNWASAYDCFVQCHKLPPARVFRSRTRGQICPKDWNGVFS